MRQLTGRVNRSIETAVDRARRFRWRIRLMTALFSLLFLTLAGRAAYLMGYPSDKLELLTERQHHQIVTLYPRRGAIFDRNGQALALSVELDSIYADPKFVRDSDNAARQLAPILKLNATELQQKMMRKLRFVWLSRRVNPKQSEEIKKLKIPGVYTVVETERFYPNRELLGAVLGFTDIDNQGIEGIERAYNKQLNGTVAQHVRLRDAKGRNITPEGVLVKQNRDGGNVTLTIDRAIQFAAEQALNKAYTDHNAKGGFVIAMDPRSGEILAVANTPGYNPNAYSQYTMAAYKNQTVVNSFEPGSTQKIFLIAGALEDKVIQPDELVNCENGSYRIGGNTIHDTHEYGQLTIEGIIQVSSNIGSAKIGERLGRNRLYDYYHAFGFGATTRSGFPGEIGGLLHAAKSWSRIGTATRSFGQGMTVTGMQIATALSTLANGGVRMQPYVVKALSDASGQLVEEYEPREVQRVVSKETADLMTRYMTAVTREGGTGTKAAIDGYPVAGKTGTAQKVDPATRRYAPGVFTSSFIGYLPADDPRILLVCVLDEPRGGRYFGGTVSAPIFADIAEVAMQRFGITPTETVADTTPRPQRGPTPKERVTVPEGEALLVSDLESPELLPIVEEEKDSSEAYLVPDFTGQPMRAVLSALDRKSFALAFSGSGVAVAQEPPPGKVLRPGDVMSVTFSTELVTRTQRKESHP